MQFSLLDGLSQYQQQQLIGNVALANRRSTLLLKA
jgi:hypothetical protein